MDNSTANKSNAALNFLTIVMILLLIAGVVFAIFSLKEENGLFAIASTISLSSLMFACLRILN